MRLIPVLVLPLLAAGCAGAPPPTPPRAAATPTPLAVQATDAGTPTVSSDLFRLPADVHPQRERVWLELIPTR
jgi:hypothetical protein